MRQRGFSFVKSFVPAGTWRRAYVVKSRHSTRFPFQEIATSRPHHAAASYVRLRRRAQVSASIAVIPNRESSGFQVIFVYGAFSHLRTWARPTVFILSRQVILKDNWRLWSTVSTVNSVAKMFANFAP